MIIWLASYPRSGNTLFRTLLHQCFNLKTYDDEAASRLFGVPEVGDIPLDIEWDEFYSRASDPKSVLKFVKTHKYPRDDRPAIVIHRDGRLATQSYLEFQRSFLDESLPKNMLRLVMGDDYYGSWSRHYRIWTGRTAPTLILSFEEIVSAKPELIEKIGDFIGVKPVTSVWINPMNELHKKKPDFFRSGNTSWQPSTELTKEIDQVFNYLHGDLMIELGYSSKESVIAATSELSPSEREALDIVEQLANRCALLQFHCDERLRVIRQLSGL